MHPSEIDCVDGKMADLVIVSFDLVVAYRKYVIVER